MDVQFLIMIAVFWVLIVLTLWFGFVGYLRWRAIRTRELMVEKKMILGTGASVSEDGEADTDKREAFNEQVAQIRGRFEKKYGAP